MGVTTNLVAEKKRISYRNSSFRISLIPREGRGPILDHPPPIFFQILYRTTKWTTYALGVIHYNPHYALVHDNWLTSWFSRPRARKSLGQPVIALWHKWIIVDNPSGIGSSPEVIPDGIGG